MLSNTSAALAASWIAVGTSDEVTCAPTRVMVLGDPWMVARLPDGRPVAFAQRFESELRHGVLPAAEVAEHLGLVWIAIGQPLAPLPQLIGWGDPSFRTASCTSVRTSVSAVQLIDNFMDAAHFPFVHPQSFGVEDAFDVVSDEIVRDEWAVRSVFTAPYQNHDDPLVASGEHPLVQTHTVTKIGLAGCNSSLELRFPVTGGVFGIVYACQPETESSTRVFKLLARNDVDEAGLARCVVDEDVVLQEDLRILEQFTSMTLPLDLTVEVHTRADRLSVAWRRLMADLCHRAHQPQAVIPRHARRAPRPSPQEISR